LLHFRGVNRMRVPANHVVEEANFTGETLGTPRFGCCGAG